MTFRSHLTAGALALGLAAAASAAIAQPYGKGGNYSMGPAPREAQAAHADQHGKCDCPMMQGDQAMREQCMSMMPEHTRPAPERGSAG